jgi:hypothetical protein
MSGTKLQMQMSCSAPYSTLIGQCQEPSYTHVCNNRLTYSSGCSVLGLRLSQRWLM